MVWPRPRKPSNRLEPKVLKQCAIDKGYSDANANAATKIHENNIQKQASQHTSQQRELAKQKPNSKKPTNQPDNQQEAFNITPTPTLRLAVTNSRNCLGAKGWVQYFRESAAARQVSPHSKPNVEHSRTTSSVTSSLAGCFGSDEDNNENDITERDQEIKTLEAEIANLTMRVTDLTGEIASMEDQYSLLMMNYNSSVLQSENLSSQLIYCEMFVYPETPICLNAQGWYAEYVIKKEAEQNLSYALEYVEWMESHLVVHLIGVNLSGADLFGADLSDSIILDSNLSGADLRWSWLNGSNLSRTDFSYAQLGDVNFGYGANITDVSFRGASLENVHFHRSIYFHGVDFSDTNIGDHFDLEPVFYNVNFSGSVFWGSDTDQGWSHYRSACGRCSSARRPS